MSSQPDRGTQTVVVGAAGTATGFGVARTLRDLWPSDVEVIAADSNPRHLVATASLSADFVQSPEVGEPTYRDWLADVLEKRSPDLYVPLLDQDIVVAAELAESGRLPSATRISSPQAASARVCLDKLETFEWLRAHGISACATWKPSEATWTGDELIAKPREGVGSSGFRRLTSVDELDRIRDRPELVVQPGCRQPEVTIDAFLSRDGNSFRAVCRERLETKAGVCTKARVFESDELAAVAEKSARGLGLTGVTCTQVMRDEADKWCVIDLNARPGGGSRLSTAAGVDILGAGFADILDRRFDLEAALQPLREDRYVVRQYDEYVV